MWRRLGERVRGRGAAWPALVVLLALVVGAAACGGSSGNSSGPAATLPEGAADPKALGPADAKVVITEYADFQ